MVERIKFDLISPTAPARRAAAGQRPPGPRAFRFSMLPSLYAAASMPSYVETRIVDEDIQPIDWNTDADLIGIPFMTYNAPRAYEIAERFRVEKGKPVVFGGYHPTLMPEEASQHADAVCVGDAEPNVPHMIDDFAAGRLSGLYTNEPTPLTNLPIPRRDLIQKQDYAPIDVVQATRGCYHQCNFCSIAAFHDQHFRARPVAEVIREIRDLGTFLLFMDDSLTSNRDYAMELFSEMVPLGKQWFSQCGIGIAEDEELLDLVSRSGCRGLFIGFESLSEQGLRSWGKRSNLGRDYLAAVRRLHAAGIAVVAAFVFGGDHDTPDVFPRTLEFLLEANVEVLQATRMTPFPGTPLRVLCAAADRALGMAQHSLHGSWRDLRAILPVNQAYRRKMAVVGTFEQGAAFNAPEGSAAPQNRPRPTHQESWQLVATGALPMAASSRFGRGAPAAVLVAETGA